MLAKDLFCLFLKQHVLKCTAYLWFSLHNRDSSLTFDVRLCLHVLSNTITVILFTFVMFFTFITVFTFDGPQTVTNVKTVTNMKIDCSVTIVMSKY